MDLVGHMHLEAQAAAVELDLVVLGERVGERVQAGGGVLPAEPLLLC